MAINDKIKSLYDTLKADGADVGSEQEFNDWFLAKGDEGYKNRKSVYDAFKADGADVGKTYEEFRDWLGLHPQTQTRTVDSTSKKPVSAKVPADSEPSYSAELPSVNDMRQKAMERMRNPIMARPKIEQAFTDNKLRNQKLEDNPDTGFEHYADDNGAYAGSRFVGQEGSLYRRQQEYKQATERPKSEDDIMSYAGEIDRAYEEAYTRDRENNASRFFGTAGYRDMGTSILSPETNDLAAAKAQMDEARTVVDAAKRARGDRNAIAGFFEDAGISFLDNIKDFDTWDFGMKSLDEANRVRMMLDKFDRGEKLTKSEEQLLNAVAMNTAAKMYYGSEQGMGNTVGATTAQMIPFMVQMAISPAGAWGKAASSKVFQKLANYAGKSLMKRLTARGIQGATRVLTDIGAGYVMAGTVGAGRTLADTERRMTGNVDVDPMTFTYNGREKGDDALSAGVKAATSQAIEYQSEMVGEYFKPLLGMVGKSVTRGIMQGSNEALKNFLQAGIATYQRLGKSKTAEFFRQLNGLTHYDGAVAEYLEEVVGNIENATSVGDMNFGTGDNGVFNLKDNVATFLSVAVPGVAQAAMVKTADWGTSAYKAHKDKVGANVFGADVWNIFKEDIDALRIEGSSADELAEKFAQIVNNVKPENEAELKALKGYFDACIIEQAIGLGQQMGDENSHADAVDTVEGATDRGRSIVTEEGLQSEEATEAKMMLEHQRARIAELATDDLITALDVDPVGTLDAIRANGEWTEDERQVAIDYVNARATYDGMIAQVRDDIGGVDAEELHETALIGRRAGEELTSTPEGVAVKERIDEMFQNGASQGELTEMLNGLSPEMADAANKYMESQAKNAGVDLQVNDKIAAAVAAERERMSQFIDADGAGYLIPVEYNGRKGYVVSGNDDEVIVKFEDNGDELPVLSGDEGLLYAEGEPNTLEDYMAQYEQRLTEQMRGEVESARMNHPLTKLEPVPGETIDTMDGKKRVAAVNDNGIFLEEPVMVLDEETGQMVPKHQKEFRPEDAVSLEEFVQKQNEYYDGMEQQERENTRMRQQAENYEPVEAVDYEQEGKADEMPVQGFDAGDVKPVSGAPADYEAAEGYEGGYDEGVTVDWREEQAKAERKKADDAIVEKMLDRDEKLSGRFVKNNLDAIEEKLKKARKKESKATDLDQFEKETAEFEAEVAALEAEKARWENIDKRIRDGRLEQQREVADDAIAKKKVAELGEPQSLREWIMRSLYNGGVKMIWGDSSENATKGLGSHTGLGRSNEEMRKRLWMLANRDKGGLYPEEAAERMLSSYASDMGWQGTEGDWPITSQDVLDELLDVVSAYGTKSSMGNAAVEANASADNSALMTDEEEQYEKDAWAKEANFNSYEEYEDYLDMVEHSVEPYTKEEYEQNKIDIAEIYEEEFLSLQQNKPLNTQEDGETNLQPSETGVQGRNGLLPEEGSGEARGIEGSADEQREDASLHNQGAGIVSQGEGAGQGVGNFGYQLSDEVDENGRQFVLTSEGNIEFGQIGENTGLTPAPILLSEGLITNKETNDGYGLVHIEARHGDQIRKAGYKSVVDFIEEVAKNYDIIKEGKNRDGNQTYMLQLTDKHNNTLMVELSGDGTYWNINTAGIFKTSYGANRREVYNRHTTAKQSAETVETSLSGEQSGTTPSTSMNVPTTSGGKGTEVSDTKQGKEEKNVENLSETDPVKRAQQIVEREKTADDYAGVRDAVKTESAALGADEAKAKAQGVDNQGNPIDENGKYIVEKVEKIDDIIDEDFTNPTRNIELPKIPEKVDSALGAEGKPVIIKKNIFEKNLLDHSDLTPEQSREILSMALYNADLYGKNKPVSKPYNWVVIRTKGEDEKNRLVLLEINENKDNVEGKTSCS